MRQVNLVNAADEIIGQADLLDAHRGDGRKHQAISLFLFHEKENGEFELLLQKRSAEKIVGALQWANTLCANLTPGEDHLTCLKRRVFEELGFKWCENWYLKEAKTLDYQVACEDGFCENEIDHFFVSVIKNDDFAKLKISPNIKEVVDSIWLDWELVKKKKIGNRVMTPWTSLFLEDDKIISQIDEVLKLWQKKNQ